MAALFQLVSSDIANEHHYNLFTLVEDLYTAAEVDLMFGDKIEDIDLEDILDGHGEDMSYLFEQLRLAHHLLCEHGLDVYEKLST